MTIITDQNKGIFPDAVFTPSDVIPDALILQVGTPGGTVEGDAPVVRVPYVATLPSVDFVDEGAPVDPSEPTYDELLVPTQKLMVISRLSREASTHGVAAQLLASSMGRALVQKANQAFINGTTPQGIAGAAGGTASGELGADLDVVLDAITSIEVAGGQATDIITDPATWSTIAKMKAGTGSNVPLIGSPAEVAERRLFGANVHVSADVEAGTLLVADRNAIIVAAGDVQVAVSEDAYFTSDTVARRVVWRLGWGITDPAKLVKITLPA